MAVVFLFFSYIFLTLSLIDLSLYPSIGIFSSIFGFFNKLNLFSNVSFFPLAIAFFVFSVFSLFKLDNKKNTFKAQLSVFVLACLVSMIFFHIPHSAVFAVILNLFFCALTVASIIFADKIFTINRETKKEVKIKKRPDKKVKERKIIVFQKTKKQVQIDDSDEYDLIDEEGDIPVIEKEKSLSCKYEEEDEEEINEDEDEEEEDAAVVDNDVPFNSLKNIENSINNKGNDRSFVVADEAVSEEVFNSYPKFESRLKIQNNIQNNVKVIKKENRFCGVGKLEGNTEGFKKWHYEFPSDDLLEIHVSKVEPLSDDEIKEYEAMLIEALKSFSIEATAGGYTAGPTAILFKIALAPGISVSRITKISDDIARYLAISSDGIRVLPSVENTHDIGIEIPNPHRQTVSFKEMTSDLRKYSANLPFTLGKSITGENVQIDISKTPHLLLAGTTGAGKSVCINSMIASLIFTRSPEQVRVVMIDPKVVELQIYNDIPHLLTPVITEPSKAIKMLEYCVEEMERRYNLVSELKVRNIEAYNKEVKEHHKEREKMPYIVVIVDEFADLMAVVGKDLEKLIARIAAKARAIGIHLVLATQRPSTDVITGVLKNNLPARIAFRVPSYTDSKTIIDYSGAEKLLGNGDMLYKSEKGISRIQGAFLSDSEVEKIVEFIKSLDKPQYLLSSVFDSSEDEEETQSEDDFSNFSDLDQRRNMWSDKDEALLQMAWQLGTESGEVTTSYIQRTLNIGYNKAAKIVEKMYERGIIDSGKNSKSRKVLKPKG